MYTGMLFTGLMRTGKGPKVFEYNARFGDSETQSILLLLEEETDLIAIMAACTEQRLSEVQIRARPKFACNIVLVAGGYLGSYSQGDIIEMGVLPEGK
jgi:phosphoribosylamine--glycine ligase/phosphoribosylformylglycinamidine cyclo-ligase